MNHRYVLLLALLAVFLRSPTPATAACPGLYMDGTTPGPRPAALVELCSDRYAVLWDPRTHNPAYSVEVLRADELRAFSPRTNDFREDYRLPPELRVRPQEYVASGYDRGHMAPSGDFTTVDTVSQSFLMTNVVPQNPASNRGPWARVEESVRSLVLSVYAGRGYLVTGPLYRSDRGLVGTAKIPSHVFKAVYVAGDAYGNRDVAGAWVADNDDEARVQFVSLSVLRDVYGVDAFPSLPEDVKSVAALPSEALARTTARHRQ